MDAPDIIAIVTDLVPGAALAAEAAIDQPTLSVDREHVVAVCHALRHAPALQFSLLADLTAVDRLPAEPRYEVVYHLACLGVFGASPAAPEAGTPKRLRLKVRLPGDEPRVQTVSTIWPSAAWPEREVWDLFGIVFEGHEDLRRILLPDDWDGHPLRKDHPVQVNRRTPSQAPLHVTQDEFVANIQASRVTGPARSDGPSAPDER